MNYSRLYESLTVCLAVLSLYLLSLSGNLSAAHDSVYYLAEIEQGAALHFHPHHLLYHPVAHFAVQLFSPFASTQWLIEALNALFGAIAMTIFFRLLRDRLLFSRATAGWGTMLAVTSFGIWGYSTVVEVYILPLSLLLLALYALSHPNPSSRSMITAGAAHALAVLFHQAHILFLPVAIWSCWQHRKKERPLQLIGAYLLAFIPLTVLPYLAVMAGPLNLAEPSAMLHWMVGYGHDDQYWQAPGLIGLVKAGVGFFRSMIGGHFLFALPLPAVESGHFLADEAFLVRGLSPTLAALQLLASLVFVAILGYGLIVALRHGAIRQLPYLSFLRMCQLCLFLYSAFFLFWVPVNPEFWLPQLLLFWLLWLGIRSAPDRVTVPLYWKIAATLLLCINLTGSIYWLRDPHNDYYFARAQLIAAHVEKGDLIITGRAWMLDPYLRRFVQAEVRSVPEWYQDHGLAAVELLQTHIDSLLQNGKTVLLSAEAVVWEKENTSIDEAEKKAFEAAWRSYAPAWEEIAHETGRLYRLRPATSLAPHPQNE